MALLFAGVLHFTACLFGTLFFDPVMLVSLSMLLGFYVVGGGILLGVASGFAAEHHLGLWKLLLAECIFAVALGVYIWLSLFMTAHTLSLLAGIHALGVGVFQLAMAIKLRHDRPSVSLLGFTAMLSEVSAYIFLIQTQQAVRIKTEWLSHFEVLCGIVALTFAWRLHESHSPHYQARTPEPIKTRTLETLHETCKPSRIVRIPREFFDRGTPRGSPHCSHHAARCCTH